MGDPTASPVKETSLPSCLDVLDGNLRTPRDGKRRGSGNAPAGKAQHEQARDGKRLSALPRFLTLATTPCRATVVLALERPQLPRPVIAKEVFRMNRDDDADDGGNEGDELDASGPHEEQRDDLETKGQAGLRDLGCHAAVRHVAYGLENRIEGIVSVRDEGHGPQSGQNARI